MTMAVDPMYRVSLLQANGVQYTFIHLCEIAGFGILQKTDCALV